jgi:alpha-pyrone synthase
LALAVSLSFDLETASVTQTATESTTGTGFALLGLGTAIPDAVFRQSEGLEISRVLCCRNSEHHAWLPALYQGTGIQTRQTCLGYQVLRDVLDGTRLSHSPFLPTGADDDRGPPTAVRLAYYAKLAPPLALAAAGKALQQSGLPAQRITHLVTVSCTGFFSPGIDLPLIQELGLLPTVERAHVGYMGCHGAINGLRVARGLAGADSRARVLLCAVELCSLHYHYGWDPQQMIANALFSDGAAAVVGMAAGADTPAWRVTATGSCLLPDSADAMTWTVGDHGFEMTLSRRVPDLIATHLRPWLQGWLAQHGLSVPQIASWAVHPGGPKILSAVEETLSLPSAATAVAREVFAKHGNMSSPTVLFILDRLRALDAKRPCVAMGFGPGLMAEAALLL